MKIDSGVTAALVAIAAETERPYLDEWVEWHLSLGFDKILLYCNNWKGDLYKHDFVETLRWDGEAMQVKAYNDALLRVQEDWAFMLDLDEYLDLRGSVLRKMLWDRDHFTGIAFNWVLFGSNGLHFNGDYSIKKRFTRCQEKFNNHIKIALNLRALRHAGILDKVKMVCPHCANIPVGDFRGEKVEGPFNKLDAKVNDTSFPLVRHYFCLTPEEFKERRKFGRADTNILHPDFMRTEKEFKEHDFNDVEYIVK